jgi:hypothetical protein
MLILLAWSFKTPWWSFTKEEVQKAQQGEQQIASRVNSNVNDNSEFRWIL